MWKRVIKLKPYLGCRIERERVYGSGCFYYNAYFKNYPLSINNLSLSECKENIEECLSFDDDEEKMIDFKSLTKEEFLASYSYLTEAEYDATVKYLKREGR